VKPNFLQSFSNLNFRKKKEKKKREMKNKRKKKEKRRKSLICYHTPLHEPQQLNIFSTFVLIEKLKAIYLHIIRINITN